MYYLLCKYGLKYKYMGTSLIETVCAWYASEIALP